MVSSIALVIYINEPCHTSFNKYFKNSIGILGAGVMGGGIAQCAILAGKKVVVRDLSEEICNKAKEVILNSRFGFNGAIELGKMTEESRDAAMGRLSFTTDVEDLKDCDLIIEAIGGGDDGAIENKPMKLRVWAEMDEVVNDARDYKIGELHIQDDSLTANKKNLYSLCDALEKLGLPWCTPNGTKVNYHFNKHDEMYKKMHDSGCYQITLACESGVQRVLDDVINKRLPLDTIYPSIEQAKRAGMLVHTYWILGYPGETFEEMQQTIDFAMNSGADSFTFSK